MVLLVVTSGIHLPVVLSRTAKGNCVKGFMSNLGIIEALIAELCLKLACDVGIKKLIVETDLL